MANVCASASPRAEVPGLPLVEGQLARAQSRVTLGREASTAFAVAVPRMSALEFVQAQGRVDAHLPEALAAVRYAEAEAAAQSRETLALQEATKVGGDEPLAEADGLSGAVVAACDFGPPQEHLVALVAQRKVQAQVQAQPLRVAEDPRRL